MLTEEEKAKLRAHNNQFLTEEDMEILRIKEKQDRAEMFQSMMLGLVGLVVAAIGIGMSLWVFQPGMEDKDRITPLILAFSGLGTVLYSFLRKTAAPWDD